MNLTRDAFDRLVQSDPDALYALFEQQEAQLAAVTARVQQLEARLGGHSQNSHRPPSSDGPRKPARRAASALGASRGIRGRRWR